MSDKIGEHISALVDDELADWEREPLIERLERDPALLGRWERYHLISDVIRSKRPATLNSDLAERVSRVLDAEPALLAAPARRRALPVSKRQVAGWAIAASVAAVAVLGVRSAVQEADKGRVDYAATVPSETVYARYDQLPHMRWDSTQPEVESRLNHYLMNHGEYSSSTPGMHSRLPSYIRMAGYESE